jgi:hypothetical protein
MTSPGGKVAALECLPTKMVNKDLKLTYLSTLVQSTMSRLNKLFHFSNNSPSLIFLGTARNLPLECNLGWAYSKNIVNEERKKVL